MASIEPNIVFLSRIWYLKCSNKNNIHFTKKFILVKVLRKRIRSYLQKQKNGDVAQPGERLLCTQEVAGSISVISIRRCSSTGRALALHARGHRFKPYHLHFMPSSSAVERLAVNQVVVGSNPTWAATSDTLCT